MLFLTILVIYRYINDNLYNVETVLVANSNMQKFRVFFSFRIFCVFSRTFSGKTVVNNVFINGYILQGIRNLLVT